MYEYAKFKTGKHAGEFYIDVLKKDRAYMIYLSEHCDFMPARYLLSGDIVVKRYGKDKEIKKTTQIIQPLKPKEEPDKIFYKGDKILWDIKRLRVIEDTGVLYWICKFCGEMHDELLKVEFSNGTEHFEARCDCGKRIMNQCYIPHKIAYQFNKIKKSKPQYKKNNKKQ